MHTSALCPWPQEGRDDIGSEIDDGQPAAFQPSAQRCERP
jgi:hypothetical protein